MCTSFDFDRFTNECMYCYDKSVLSVCSCGYSMCDIHREIHENKCGCFKVMEIRKEGSEEVSVNIMNEDVIKEYFIRMNYISTIKDNNDNKDICILIKDIIKAKDNSNVYDSSKYCPHLKDNIDKLKTELNIVAQCPTCNAFDNLYVCMGCGYVGCGRAQYGVDSNGCMLKHYEKFKEIDKKEINTSNELNTHTHVVQIKSKKCYCYICDSIINNLINIKLKKVENAFMNLLKLTSEEELSVKNKQRNNRNAFMDNIADTFDLNKYHEDIKESDKILENNSLGIVNGGNTCYISTVMHVMAEIVKEEMDNLQMHFMLCENMPDKCMMCQMIRIFGALHKKKDRKDCKTNSININIFLKLFFDEFNYIFKKGSQCDASEFMQCLLDKIKQYEEVGLIGNISGLVSYAIEMHSMCVECEEKTTFKDSGALMLVSFIQNDKNNKNEITQMVHNSFNVNVNCNKCGHKLEKIEENDVKLSRYVAISLVRCKISNGVPIKINEDVEINDTLKIEGVEYELVGVIIHKGGSLNSGHYVYYDRANNYVISDETVRKVLPGDKEQGYVVLYKRINN